MPADDIAPKTSPINRHRKRSPNWKHGASGTREYDSWRGMLRRCFAPNVKSYPRYGGRGITVCKRWHSFENFLADMGARPKGTTIDRYPDNNGNYEPGNCRWATPVQQGNNTRANIMLDIGGGLDGNLSEWCQALGLNISTVWKRIKQGQSPREALLTPMSVQRTSWRAEAASLQAAYRAGRDLTDICAEHKKRFSLLV